MGRVRNDYGDACGSARNAARYGLALSRARELAGTEKFEFLVVEGFVGALHEMPAWALRAIADKIDPALPET